MQEKKIFQWFLFSCLRIYKCLWNIIWKKKINIKIEEEGQFSVIGFILDFSSYYIVNALCISIPFFPENMCD